MIFDLLTCCSPLLLTIGSDFQFTFSFRISCWDFNDCPAPVTNPPTLSPTRTPLTRRPTISTQESPSSGGLPIPIMFIIFPVVAIGSILVLAGVGKYCRRRNAAADINDINNIAQPISSTTNTKGNNDIGVAQPTTNSAGFLALFGNNSKATHATKPPSRHDASVSYSANTYSQASAPPQVSKPSDGKSLFDELNTA